MDTGTSESLLLPMDERAEEAALPICMCANTGL